MYKEYNYLPSDKEKLSARIKFEKAIMLLDLDDPIRIFGELFAFRNIYIDKTKEQRESLLIEYIERVNPSLKKEESIPHKIQMFHIRRDDFLEKHLDGDKLITFLETHGIDPYSFVIAYLHILSFSDHNGEIKTKKGFDKIHNFKREYLRNTFGESFVKKLPKFE